MFEFYPQIKAVHVAMVLASGGLFLLRGLLAWNGPRTGTAIAMLRYSSYAVDTTLLTAAMMLLTFLPHAVFANGWLLAKLALLVVYVALGMLALRPARSLAARRICFVAALLVFGFMLSIARTHQPWGLLALAQPALLR
jgi:uncharacterized membrane protein SirB2